MEFHSKPLTKAYVDQFEHLVLSEGYNPPEDLAYFRNCVEHLDPTSVEYIVQLSRWYADDAALFKALASQDQAVSAYTIEAWKKAVKHSMVDEHIRFYIHLLRWDTAAANYQVHHDGLHTSSRRPLRSPPTPKQAEKQFSRKSKRSAARPIMERLDSNFGNSEMDLDYWFPQFSNWREDNKFYDFMPQHDERVFELRKTFLLERDIVPQWDLETDVLTQQVHMFCSGEIPNVEDVFKPHIEPPTSYTASQLQNQDGQTMLHVAMNYVLDNGGLIYTPRLDTDPEQVVMTVGYWKASSLAMEDIGSIFEYKASSVVDCVKDGCMVRELRERVRRDGLVG